ncbi:PRTRC system protein E [Ramlibacter sp. AN1133]|uniref:PRTRC system protein E n=1 Tax=Ramlibacter sp. AN1133 TaxID=3133429 RepID=UPI0030BF39C9
MQLISPFASLLKGGVTLNLKISAGGGDNIQLDILPRGKDSATGVALPPKALVGTAQELDAHLEEYLRKYAASLARVADVLATADVELQRLEDAASAQARKALEDKSRSKASAGKPQGKPASTGARKDLSAGLVDEGDDEHDGDGDGEGHDASTALVTTGSAGDALPAASTQSAAAAPGDGMSQALFV